MEEKPKANHAKTGCAIVAGILVLLFVIGSMGGKDKPSDKAEVNVTPKTPGMNAKPVQSNAVEEDSAEVEPQLTGPQQNAVRNAEQYLSMTGFSRAGLIGQLSSEYGSGYSVADATVAVDSLDVDWNEQAVRSARSYLEMTGFSCKGLIEQLSSDAGSKYTKSEATYGAQQAGAC